MDSCVRGNDGQTAITHFHAPEWPPRGNGDYSEEDSSSARSSRSMA